MQEETTYRSIFCLQARDDPSWKEKRVNQRREEGEESIIEDLKTKPTRCHVVQNNV